MTTYTTSSLNYYSQPGTTTTTTTTQPVQPPITKSPSPPGMAPTSYQKLTVKQSTPSSGIFTILLTIGLILLCGGIFVILGGRLGPFESNTIEAPTLQPLPQYTNQTNIIVNGTAVANSPIEIYANGEKVAETASDAAGKFAGQFRIEQEKAYSVNAVVIRNVVLRFRSPFSNTVTIILDKTNPVINVTKPTNPVNSSDYTLSGKVTERGKVTVDVKGIKTEANTNADGTFSVPLKITSGSTPITLYATDLAGNQSKTEQLTVAYVIPSITTGPKITVTPSVLPNSSGLLGSAMQSIFANYMIAVFAVLGLLTYAASYSAMWLVRNVRAQ